MDEVLLYSEAYVDCKATDSTGRYKGECAGDARASRTASSLYRDGWHVELTTCKVVSM